MRQAHSGMFSYLAVTLVIATKIIKAASDFIKSAPYFIIFF